MRTTLNHSQTFLVWKSHMITLFTRFLILPIIISHKQQGNWFSSHIWIKLPLFQVEITRNKTYNETKQDYYTSDFGLNLNRTFRFRLEVIFITSCNLCFCITQSSAKGLLSPGIVLRDHCWHAGSRYHRGCWDFNMGWPYTRQAPTFLSHNFP